MSENETVVKENKLIKSLIPKISEYFKKNEYIEKSQLTDFLNYIDLSTWNEKDKEKFWSEISKDKGQPSNKVQKVLLIKNLTQYIHAHSNELFQPEESLKNSVLNFITKPKQLEIEIDPENEQIYEFYRLLATIQFSSSKIIPLFTLDEQLKVYNFINLNKDSLLEIMEELLKEKCTSIKKEQYINLMEQMDKKFKNQMEERSKLKRVFTDEELEHPELSSFNDIMTINKILFNIIDSIFLSHEKCCQNERNNDKLKAEYFNKTFNIFLNNAKLYLYEISRIYNEQKQKFDYFECTMVSRNTLYKQQINDLKEELKRQKEIEEYKIKEGIQAINSEIINEKNKYEKINNDIKIIKKEKEKINEDLIIAQNKIINLEKQLEEKDKKVNIIKKENEIMSEKYKEVLATLNSQLYSIRERENQANEILKNMNLNERQKLLVKKDPQELISYIVEKDNYCVTIENKYKELMEKITQIEKEKENIENNLYEMKSKILTLDNKNVNLIRENEELQKIIDENKEQKSFLLSNILDNNDENENNNNTINKNITYIKINTTQLSYKGIKPKKIKKKKKSYRDYDFLCIKMDERIIQNLIDEYYNGTSNLIFSELINYLDDEKEITECILFITNDYLYLFNNVTYQKCFSISIDDLRNVFISTLNNYISMTFENGEIINFELFRILELMNFLKSLNALYKTKQQIDINMSDFNNQFVKNNPKNFTVSPYQGRAIFSGHLKKRVDWIIIKSGFEKRFVVLTEIGLIIMDQPNGKPLEIINLLFAKWVKYNGGDGAYCFDIIIGKNKHCFSSDTESLRNKWIFEIEKWVNKIKEEETISV